MNEHEPRIAHAVRNTHVVRPPRQTLATFGTTTIRYYLVTEPLYGEIDPGKERDEAVVREGTVMAERPQVVTPYYLSRTEGFSENAAQYLERLVQEYGPHAPGLLYAYKNQDCRRPSSLAVRWRWPPGSAGGWTGRTGAWRRSSVASTSYGTFH